MSRYLVTPQHLIDSCVGCEKIITDTVTGAMFSENTENPNYLVYLAWLEEGNTPDEWTFTEEGGGE